MPDHERDHQRDAGLGADRFDANPTAATLDLAAALGGLDRATRNFTRRLGEGNLGPVAPGVPEPRSQPAPQQRRPSSQLGAPVAEPPRADPAARGADRPYEPRFRARDESFDARMVDAEREAHAYLESAKRRAESLVATMVGAVEHEAAEIRRDAELGIRARWQQVEVDASRHVENARRVAERMVAERQERIGSLSDGITSRAGALTTGMDDAEHVRGQFDAFVRSLSVTADRIARGSGDRPNAAGEIHELRERPRPSAIAA